MASDIGKSLDEDGLTADNAAILGFLVATRGKVKVKGKASSKVTELIEKAKNKFGWKPPKLDVNVKGGVGGAKGGVVSTSDIEKMNANINKYGQPNPTIYKKMLFINH